MIINKVGGEGLESKNGQKADVKMSKFVVPGRDQPPKTLDSRLPKTLSFVRPSMTNASSTFPKCHAVCSVFMF